MRDIGYFFKGTPYLCAFSYARMIARFSRQIHSLGGTTIVFMSLTDGHLSMYIVLYGHITSAVI
jgi:hypothetical protein